MKIKKNDIQLCVAVVLCILGITLLILAFCINPTGEIHNSVLIAFGEVMTFAGALFGIDYHYRDRAIRVLKDKFNDEPNNEDRI